MVPPAANGHSTIDAPFLTAFVSGITMLPHNMLAPSVDSPMTQLLVSVQSRNEALDAVRGGADIVDVKAPSRGALGRADTSVVESVIDAVSNQVPVSMACGELVDFRNQPVPASLRFAKIGLAGCVTHAIRFDAKELKPELPIANGNKANRTDPASITRASGNPENDRWKQHWIQWNDSLPSQVRPIAVIYADAANACAPDPLDIISFSQDLGCQGVLVDTFLKQESLSLFDWRSPAQIGQWIHLVHSADQFIAIAGSLGVDHLPQLSEMEIDVIAVRGAVCEHGRRSKICPQKVRRLSDAISQMRSQRAR